MGGNNPKHNNVTEYKKSDYLYNAFHRYMCNKKFATMFTLVTLRNFYFACMTNIAIKPCLIWTTLFDKQSIDMFMNELNHIVIIVIPNMHKYTSGFGLHDIAISGGTDLGFILT